MAYGVKKAMQGSDWIDGLGMINDELDGSSPTVILMASSWNLNFFPGPDGQEHWDGFILRHKELLDSLVSKGAILVTGTGNGHSARVDGVPGRYGKPGLGSAYVPSLLVVGGLYADGVTGIWGDSEPESGVPHVYAPGKNMISLDRNKDFWKPELNNGLLSTSGTSCSAALTAGLAAYYIRMSQLGLIDSGTSPQAIKDLIFKSSWSRKDIFDLPRPGIWNGADVVSPAKEWTLNTASRRSLFGRRVYA